MNPQKTQQVDARDEKWVPSTERVKISSTNIILETIQFWYTIKKVQDTNSYEFLLANKKCTVNAEVFRIILDICPRVEGLDFTDVLDDDTTLTFLIDLGYKGPLNRHTNMIKFVRIGEDYQEYRLPIPDVMLNDAIKHSKSYQMFIKYSTNQIPPKKRRGKAKKKTSSKRRVKKKVTLSADENIITDDPDDVLELAKSISQTEAEEAEAAMKVHATHARIVTESVLKSAKKKSGGRSSKSVVIQDTLNIMQALKESMKISRSQPSTGGLNEGTGSKPGVLDESIVISATSSEGTGIKLGVLDEEKDITEEKVILEWGDEQDSKFSDDDNDDVEKDDKDGNANDEGDDHVNDTQDVDDEDVETESDEEDIYKYKIRVHKDEDEEMINAKVDDSDKGDEEIIDAAKGDAEKTSEAKDDTKKTELPPSSSSLFVSSCFGDQFFKLSSDSFLVSTVKDSADTDVSCFLDIPIQQETPQTQSPSVQMDPVSVIPKTTNLPPIPKILTKTLVSTIVSSPQVAPIISSVQQTPTPIPTQPIITDAPTIMNDVLESNALTVVELRVEKLEKDVSELKLITPLKLLQFLSPKFPRLLIHLPELTKKPTPIAKQESEKSPSDILKIKKE
ncbi:hypothetical protein Tco_0262343 [Tanacetum coccineum]